MAPTAAARQVPLRADYGGKNCGSPRMGLSTLVAPDHSGAGKGPTVVQSPDNVPLSHPASHGAPRCSQARGSPALPS